MIPSRAEYLHQCEFAENETGRRPLDSPIACFRRDSPITLYWSGTGTVLIHFHVSFFPILSHFSVPAASKRCDLTFAKRNKANNVTFSGKRNRKWQEVNLQSKKVYWPEGQRWVQLKVSTSALKTIEKNGLDSMAREAGLDLWKLPFTDVRPERLAFKAETKGTVPTPKNPGNKKMKNPERLAASKKSPNLFKYEMGRIVSYKASD